jgi:hypothetical protein
VRRALLALALSASPLLGGCINTDAAVFVDPSIESATIDVTKGLLGTSVKGSFKLTLHLGARASGPSDVSDLSIDLRDAKGEAAITDITAILDAGPTQFPVRVEPDSDVDVAMTFDTGSKPVDEALADKLCDPAGVTIGGTLKDSLQDTATPLDSPVIHATGCM